MPNAAERETWTGSWYGGARIGGWVIPAAVVAVRSWFPDIEPGTVVEVVVWSGWWYDEGAQGLADDRVDGVLALLHFLVPAEHGERNRPTPMGAPTIAESELHMTLSELRIPSWG